MPEELAPAEAPAEVAPTTAAPETATEVDPFDSPDTDTFDRSYVEKLRNEAAKNRTEAKQYKDAFEGYDEQSQGVLLNVVNLLKTDQTAGVKALQEIVQFLSPEDAAAVTEAVEEATGEIAAPELTVAEQVEAALAERDRTSSEQAKVDAIISKATELGYPADDPQHITLLWIANNQTGGDLDKAAAKIAESDQAKIDAYIAKKAADNDKFITPSNGAAPAPGAAKAGGFKDARARVEARLEGTANPA